MTRRTAERRAQKTPDRNARVGVSAGARALIGFIWLLVAVVPVAGLVAAIVLAVGPNNEGAQSVAAAWVVVGIAAVLPLVVFYYAGRQLTRSCRPEGDGLRLKGFWRTRHVRWPLVRDTRATRTIVTQTGRGAVIKFSNVKVVYMRPDGRAKAVQVSASQNRYARDALLIALWSPPGHPLRARLPASLRDAVALPELSDHEEQEAHQAHEPGLCTLRCRVSLRVLQAFGFTVLLAIAGGFAVLGGFALPHANRIVGAVLLVLFVPSSILLVVSIVKAFTQRIEVYRDAIVCYGQMTTKHYYREDVSELRRQSSGAGSVIALQLVNGITHPLPATAVWKTPDEDEDRTLNQLRDWAAGTLTSEAPP